MKPIPHWRRVLALPKPRRKPVPDPVPAPVGRPAPRKAAEVVGVRPVGTFGEVKW